MSTIIHHTRAADDMNANASGGWITGDLRIEADASSRWRKSSHSVGGYCVEIVRVAVVAPCKGCTFCGGDCTDGFGRKCPMCT